MTFFANQPTPPSRWKNIRRAILVLLNFALLRLFAPMIVQLPPRDTTGWLMVVLMLMILGIGLSALAMGYLTDRRHARRFAQWKREMVADGQAHGRH